MSWLCCFVVKQDNPAAGHAGFLAVLQRGLRSGGGGSRFETIGPRASRSHGKGLLVGFGEVLSKGTLRLAMRSGVMNMREAMHFTLTHPVSTVIIGCDSIQQLEENVQIARDFTPLSHSQMVALNELAAAVAKQSLFFRFTDRSKG